MKKIIKKIGNSLGIIFDREDCKIHNFKEGDVLQINFLLIRDGKTRIDFKFSDLELRYLKKQAEKANLTVKEYLETKFARDKD